ncbi:MAG: YpmS family protein [Heyndrickxia sp.]
MNNVKNRWKIAFFALLIIIVIFVMIIGFFVFLPTGKETLPKTNINSDKYVQFHIRTNKADLNKLINHYIEKEGLDGPIKYNVYLKKDVEFEGSLPVFSENVHLKMTFQPEALKNGDLILKQKTISIGHLNLPVSYVLKFIKNSYKLPDWVSIDSDEKTVYVGLQKMKVGQSDMKARVDKFNLKENDISFTLLFPVEK